MWKNRKQLFGWVIGFCHRRCIKKVFQQSVFFFFNIRFESLNICDKYIFCVPACLTSIQKWNDWYIAFQSSRALTSNSSLRLMQYTFPISLSKRKLAFILNAPLPRRMHVGQYYLCTCQINLSPVCYELVSGPMSKLWFLYAYVSRRKRTRQLEVTID